jgi:hypothetical protein
VPAPIKMLFQAAIRDARLSDSEKLVGLVLSTYMGAEGCAWPSVATLAHGANRRAADFAALGASLNVPGDGLDP